MFTFGESTPRSYHAERACPIVDAVFFHGEDIATIFTTGIGHGRTTPNTRNIVAEVEVCKCR